MHDKQTIENMLKECKSLNLLYVEDNPLLSKSTLAMLLPFFNSVLLVSNGEEGLQAYQNAKFDIVLTDIEMPKLDGCAMSRQIRQIDPNQAIVVMSAHEDAGYFLELIDIGISNFIAKPPQMHHLVRVFTTTAIGINNAKKVAAFTQEMEQDLAQSKGLLRSVVDTVPMRIFWKDKDLRYLGGNALFVKDASLSNQDELIGKSDFELPWKAEAQGYIDDDNLVINSQQAKLYYEERQTQANGETVWLSTSKVPLKNASGETIGILGAYMDVTKQKEAMTALKKAKNELGYQAEHDALTGLPNRFLYFDRLREAIKKTSRTHEMVAVIFLDLDRFKEINDSLGHEIGDEVIKLLGKRLELELREIDTIARFGGDEFVILIEAVTDLEDIEKIVQKIVLSMQEPFELQNHQLHLTISAGISMYPNDGEDAETLIRNADTAMYRAKDEGRNTYQCYAKEMTQKMIMHMTMAKDIRKAIENNEFTLYYQPQIDASTNKMCGMEALIRWNHPTQGFISPALFIPIAEDSGLINKIGEFVFTQAATQITKWYEKGLYPGRMAINISAIELESNDFVESIEKKMLDIGCKGQWIELEITEGYTMKNPTQSIKMLQKFKDLGIHLSIDDFGTGYSSLSYLKKLPVDKLKIDQSFVTDLPGDSEDAAIVESIISLARTMQFDVIAEGVETLEQRNFLLEKGCNKIQGYFYAKPMPPKEIEQFLKSFKS